MARDWDDSEPYGPWQNLPSTQTPVPAEWFTAVDEQMEDLADGSTGRVKVLEQKLPAGQVPVTLPEGTTAAVGGVLAVDDDGDGYQVAQTPWYFVPPPSGSAAADTAAIIAMASAAEAAGGGTVVFPAGTYILTQTLPLRPGVTYQGVPPVIMQQSQIRPAYTPDGYWNTLDGTILQGDGTFPCFSVNTTTPTPLPTALGSTEINGVGVIGFGIEHFSYGVQAGAMDIAGLLWGRLDELYIRDCTQWGVYLANYQHLAVGAIRTSECGVGGQYYADLVSGSGPYYGNTLFRDIYHKSQNQRLNRGIVFESRGGPNAVLGETTINRVQCNAYNRTKLTTTATFTSGNTGIAVPDGTQFAVGLPVVFTATNYGVTASNVYMVRSVSGNNITVAAAKNNGSVVSATGSGALTLESWGMPNLEFVGANPSGISSIRAQDIDVEGSSSAAIYLENVTLGELSISATPLETHGGVVGRTVIRTKFHSSVDTPTDFDTNLTGSMWFGNRGATLGFPLTGFWRDSILGTECIALSPGVVGATGGDIHRRANNFLYPNSGFGERIVPRNSGTSLNGSNCGDVVYAGATNITFTLPTISNAATTTTQVGMWFEIINVGSATITVNTDGTQLMNKITGRTTTTIAAGQAIKFIAVADGAGTLFWVAKPISLLS